MPIVYNTDKVSDVNEKKEFKPLEEGQYKANIDELQVPREDLFIEKTNCLVDILKMRLSISKENNPQLDRDRKIFADIFITKERDSKPPTEKDNIPFHAFLTSIDYPVGKTEVENQVVIPGGISEIDDDVLIGKPVLVKVGHRQYTSNDGEKVTTEKVVYWDKWIGGTQIIATANDDDLPF